MSLIQTKLRFMYSGSYAAARPAFCQQGFASVFCSKQSELILHGVMRLLRRKKLGEGHLSLSTCMTLFPTHLVVHTHTHTHTRRFLNWRLYKMKKIKKHTCTHHNKDWKQVTMKNNPESPVSVTDPWGTEQVYKTMRQDFIALERFTILSFVPSLSGKL